MKRIPCSFALFSGGEANSSHHQTICQNMSIMLGLDIRISFQQCEIFQNWIPIPVVYPENLSLSANAIPNIYKNLQPKDYNISSS